MAVFLNSKIGLIVLITSSTVLFILLLSLIMFVKPNLFYYLLNPNFLSGFNKIGNPKIQINYDGPLMVKNGAVSSGNTLCNQLGLDVLKDGGNAIDASITTALCLGVKNMFASGIGGGAIMLIHRENEEPLSIDCREVAPYSSSEDMFVDNPTKSILGGLAVGIPGELMCMDYAFNNYGSGRVTWKRLFDPIIELTRNGFIVDDLMERSLSLKEQLIFNDTELKRYFTKNNKLLRKGDRVKMDKLSHTLDIISRQGIKAFYNGSLTSTLVEEINSKGGNVTIKDFNDYQIKLQGVYNSNYRNYTIYTPKLPFSGGLMLIQSLNILENFDLDKRIYSSEVIHILIETMKFAFSNRLVLGDPDYTNLTLVEPAMLSKSHASMLASKIKLNTTHPPEYYLDLAKNEADIMAPKGHGTEHISVVDSNRTAVAFTTSVNLSWGAGFIGPKSGILWNNQMDDFNSPPTDNTTLPSYSTNYPGPRKRPLSSMSPTFIFDEENKLIMVTGGSGGPRIFTGTLLNIILTLDFKQNLKQATHFTRYHHQLKPNTVLVEPSFSNSTLDELAHFGHEFSYEERYNVINSIQIEWNGNDSLLYAESDWRYAYSSVIY